MYYKAKWSFDCIVTIKMRMMKENSEYSPLNQAITLKQE